MAVEVDDIEQVGQTLVGQGGCLKRQLAEHPQVALQPYQLARVLECVRCPLRRVAAHQVVQQVRHPYHHRLADVAREYRCSYPRHSGLPIQYTLSLKLPTPSNT